MLCSGMKATHESGKLVVLMGVAGVGKTTVGRLLARDLGWRFADADDIHPPENLKKMASGVPLTERDRKPWLIAAKYTVNELRLSGENAVIAFPGLKQSHRDRVLGGNIHPIIVHLVGDIELIRARLSSREGHFFHAGLLQSQLDLLEHPSDAFTIDVSLGPAEIVATIRKHLWV